MDSDTIIDIPLGEGAWDECVNSFLGMRMSYNQKAGVLKMDVENKIDCFFEEHRDAFKARVM